MKEIMEYLPILLPIAVINIALSLTALIHVLRHKKYRFGKRALWIVLCFVQIIGPVIYFAFGRGEEE